MGLPRGISRRIGMWRRCVACMGANVKRGGVEFPDYGGHSDRTKVNLAKGSSSTDERE